MAEDHLAAAARRVCAREHGTRYVYGRSYGGRMRPAGQPCDACRRTAAAEAAKGTGGTVR